MDKEIRVIVNHIRRRDIGIEVGKNWILSEYKFHGTLKKKVTDEVVDILESVQCYLLGINVGAELISEVIEKYKI